MKILLTATCLFVSINAFADVIDLGSFEGRSDTNGHSSSFNWISDVNQVNQRVNSFSNVYTFELNAPAAILGISYNVGAVDTVAYRQGTLVSRQYTLEKRSDFGTWQIIAAVNSKDYADASYGMWSLLDMRKSDGSFYPANPNHTDTMGKYRLTLAAQADQGQYLSSSFNLNANWGLNANAPIVTAPVPEPETYALMGLGLLSLIGARRRKMI